MGACLQVAASDAETADMSDSDRDILTAIYQAIDPDALWVAVSLINTDDPDELSERLAELERRHRVETSIRGGVEVVRPLPLADVDLGLPPLGT
jgi:hypothetical protein